jgi:5-methylcytosine-specific restriction endonuclease McrA
VATGARWGSVHPEVRKRLRAATLARYGPVCWLCRRDIDLSLRWPDRMSYSIDHVVSIDAGGKLLDLDNLRPSHLTCNTARQARDVDVIDPDKVPPRWRYTSDGRRVRVGARHWRTRTSTSDTSSTESWEPRLQW